MKRAARFINDKSTNPISEYDTTQIHAVHFISAYTNRSVTENGASGYKTTGHPLLDLNFKVSSLRNREEAFIVKEFILAFYADRIHAVKWLFFLRDIKEGLGERRSFRICMKYLAQSHPAIALSVMRLIPEYGRFDDLLIYLDTPLWQEACAYIQTLLQQDIKAMEEARPISLLAKWLPSNNTSSKESRRLAKILTKYMKLQPGEYRKMLSKLRAYLQVVETQISANAWADVVYGQVPAKAQLKYDDAFARHDSDRRIAYLKSVYLGEEGIHAKGLMPYEIVHRIQSKSHNGYTLQDDLLSELMWQKIVAEGFQNDWGLEDCIVVADGSGSMMAKVSGSTSVSALEVCNSLAIYFAQQLKGVFHNKAITFSARPQFIDLEPGNSLKEKLEIMLSHCEVANTNIKAVFDMLLAMAVSNQVPATELPKQILIISDMEFDMAQGYYSYYGKMAQEGFDQALFDQVATEYKKRGYTMPKLIFWNVCGRTDTIPMVSEESDICLLSGFSQNAMKIAAQTEVKTPYQRLLQTLDSPRYQAVEEALKSA